MNALDRALGEAVRAAGPHASAVTLAVTCGDREEIRCHGRTAWEPGAPPCTPATVFELGSVSKTFTALLLAELATRGELALDDPVERRLPPHWRPARSGSARPIRLLHLATHTSGLPRLPPGLLLSALPDWFGNPYATFDDRRLAGALARTTVHGTPGSRYRYSNYGVGLLGRLLAETGGLPYGELLAERIGRPLGLTATGCRPDAPELAVGYRHRRARPPWLIPGLPGAGAVRSSGADLTHYLRAHAEGRNGRLGAALAEVQRLRLRLPGSTDRLGLVWMHRHSGDRDLYFHTGGTRGFTSFVGFSPQGPTTVAALANTGPALDGRFVQAGYDLLRAAAGLD
ncbi:serine hydrolase domain-containing protein [Kitasatospora sp. NPDC002040]|uniref:serine hydrolase domain-containing protein n=1 Tax=Kitasatospora sp. NPDC002040 TaxID=3154661 RepID=UPI00332E7987